MDNTVQDEVIAVAGDSPCVNLPTVTWFSRDPAQTKLGDGLLIF